MLSKEIYDIKYTLKSFIRKLFRNPENDILLLKMFLSIVKNHNQDPISAAYRFISKV